MPKNSEVRITNRLFHDYLENEHSHALFRFELQKPEKYNSETDLYAGIGDIGVTPWNMLTESKSYFLIECKRIDGKNPLNKEYVEEGVQRFIGESPKYMSYYGRSIMLGYVVTPISIPENIKKIDALQTKLLSGVSASNFVLTRHNLEWYVYSSDYTTNRMCVALDHLFYDLSGAVQSI